MLLGLFLLLLLLGFCSATFSADVSSSPNGAVTSAAFARFQQLQGGPLLPPVGLWVAEAVPLRQQCSTLKALSLGSPPLLTAPALSSAQAAASASLSLLRMLMVTAVMVALLMSIMLLLAAILTVMLCVMVAVTIVDAGDVGDDGGLFLGQ